MLIYLTILTFFILQLWLLFLFFLLIASQMWLFITIYLDYNWVRIVLINSQLLEKVWIEEKVAITFFKLHSEKKQT